MEQRNELPKHMPVDMALAPDQKPYEHTHVIHTSKPTSEENRLAQHSLSPEKLGVVGYVKDVAGFVKDVVHERRSARRSSASSVTSASDKPLIEQETAAGTGEEKQRRRSSAEHVLQQQQKEQQQQKQQQQHPSGLAGAVTGLFPGVGNSNENAAGCTHADDLRNQMMHINSEENNRKIL
ncbi:ER-derived vesicles protein erv29 [Mucor velutinosus]|uniref:ER-derived vesicles protein erv29 n=1 Tax=Mucor velutinosus TaxID=708070 RepID=A0AAN7DDR1_9FUNG|nr:ER-derived vesicles protein erv29 [Mucor velutinosus]